MIGKLAFVILSAVSLAVLSAIPAGAAPTIYSVSCHTTTPNGPNGMNFVCYAQVNEQYGYHYYWTPALAGHIAVENRNSTMTEGVCTRWTSHSVTFSVWDEMGSGTSAYRNAPVNCSWEQ